MRILNYQFLVQSLFQAKTTLLPKSAGRDSFCEVCLRLPYFKISWHQKPISRESQKQMRGMISLFLTPCSVTKSAGFLSHTEVVVQLYFKGKAKVSNFLTSASSFTFNFFRTIKIMTFLTI